MVKFLRLRTGLIYAILVGINDLTVCVSQFIRTHTGQS